MELIDKIHELEAQQVSYIEKLQAISNTIEDLRKDCKHNYVFTKDGWFDDVAICSLCDRRIRR